MENTAFIVSNFFDHQMKFYFEGILMTFEQKVASFVYFRIKNQFIVF